MGRPRAYIVPSDPGASPRFHERSLTRHSVSNKIPKIIRPGGEELKTEAGDKVRVKVGDHSGKRGVIEAIEGGKVVVRLTDSARTLRLLAEQVTNFSLAARKAWITEPDRGVGRRKGTKRRDRVTITFRIDRELWERFTELIEGGLIADRNTLVNAWFREKLADTGGGGR